MCIYREYVQPYFLVIQYLHIFTLTLYLRDISVPLIDGESGSGQKVFVLERIDCIIVIIIIIIILLLLLLLLLLLSPLLLSATIIVIVIIIILSSFSIIDIIQHY